MSQNKNLSEIISNNFFAGVADLQKKVPFSAKNFAGIPEGEIIFQNDDESNYVYLVIEGEIKLKFSNPNGSSVIITKRKNEFFGEREILDKTPRSSAAVANTDCIVYKLSKKDISSLLKKDPEIEKNILRLDVQISDEDSVSTEDIYLSDEAEIEPAEQISDSEENINAAAENETEEPEVPLTENDDSKYLSEPEIKEDTYPVEENFPDEAAEDINDEVKAETEPAKKESINDDLILDDDEGYLQWEINEDRNSPELPAEEPVEEENKTEETEIPPLEDKEDGIHDENPEEEFPDQKDEPAINAEEIKTGGEPGSTEDNNLKDKMPETAAEVTTARLIKAASRIGGALTASEICRVTAEETASLTDAWKALFYLADNESQTLRSYLIIGQEEKPIKLKIGEGLAGDCAALSSVINLKDASSDTRFNPKIDQPDGIKTKSMLCVPVLDDETNLSGVIQLFNSGKGSFSKEDEVLIKEISAAAVSAAAKLKESEKSGTEDGSELLEKLTHFIINDINTPLLTIKHYADFIMKKEKNDDIRKVSEIISDQAAAAYDLLQSTLHYAEGMESLHKESAKISEILDVALEMLAEYAESRNVKLFKKYDTECTVEADRKSLYQACYQIVKNACDAMPDGGEIYVAAEEENGSISLSFTDTGAGLSAELGDDIFKPFFSKGKEKSAGLGLAIADKIITLHGGRITAGNDPEKGAVFTIFLPAAE